MKMKNKQFKIFGRVGISSMLVYYPFALTLLLLTRISAYSQSSDFYAFYTRLDYEDNNNTGKYADIVVNLSNQGRLVFSREYSYLPYWATNKSKYFVDRIIPFNGDGPVERPDKVNKCSYVRVIENSGDKIIIHRRYAPDQTSINFTDFKKSYDGDIGKYFADYVDEYFIIKPDGTVTRKVRKGCYSLDDWNDPLNVTMQVLKLTSTGITMQSTIPVRTQNLPGKGISGATVKKWDKISPSAWWKFDEGLNTSPNNTKESVRGYNCNISGTASFWRAGVSGTCLSYDGYTNKVIVPASELPQITGDFTIEAWIAPQEYSWNWSGIVDHDKDKRAGYSMGINHLGQIGLYAYIGGEWQGLTSKKSVELLKWTCVTGVYEKNKGFAIYFNGVLIDTMPASGVISDATGLDLYFGMAHKKDYPWAFERAITKSFLSNMVFSGLIDEVRIFDKALNPSEIYSDYTAFIPEIQQPLQYWVLPAGPAESTHFGATYTKLKCSPEWDGLWRVGDYADIVVSFDDKPCRFVFWRGTNYLPSLVTEPGSKGIWVNDQGPENYTNQCYEHMSDKICRYSHVRLIENTDARVVVHWRNASVGVSYDWLRTDKNGWGLWTDEYWYIYPDAVSVRYQVSGRLKDFPNTQTQQNELLSQPGTRPEDNVSYDAITLSNKEGEIETWNYSVDPTFKKGNQTPENKNLVYLFNQDGEPEVWDYSVDPSARKGKPVAENKNLVYLNLKSEYKHFNIGETGSYWTPKNQWESMRLAPGFSRYNVWDHYPFGLLPSDGTVATGKDRTSSACLGTLSGLQHLLDDGRSELYNIYGITNLPATELKILNRSWNTAPQLTDMTGGESNGYDKRQRAYVMKKGSDELSFKLNGSEENPVLNPCFVIKNWGSKPLTYIKINDEKVVPDKNFRQGIIRDTDGTQTLVIWINQKSFEKVSYKISK
jgi:hypothetical protein